MKSYIGFGDSITEGIATNGNTYLLQLQALLGSGWAVTNRGIQGNETSDLLARVGADVNPLYNAGYDQNIVGVLVGLNDIARASRTVAQAAENLRQIHQGLHAIGFQTIACTILLDKYANRAQILEYNDIIRANWQAWGCSALLDLAAEPGLTDTNDQSIFPDGTHPNATGAGSIAAAVYRSILALQPSVGFPLGYSLQN